MTDNTQPEALDLADWLESVGGGPSAKRCAALLREQHAPLDDQQWTIAALNSCIGRETTTENLTVVGRLEARIADLEAQLEAIGAGGVNGPLVGRASLSANAGEPMFWVRLCGDGLYEGPIHNARIEEVRKQSGVWSPLYLAAPPTAHAAGWRPIETAPRDGTEVLANTSGLGRVVVYWDDGESQWGTGLGYLDRDAPTHWMPLPPPPTSAEGVEHG